MNGNSSTRIRSMGAGDPDRLVEIAAGVDHAPQWPRRVYEAVLDPTSPRRIALVAEDMGTGLVAGFVVAALVPPEAELESIAVSEEYQRRGVAKRLMEAMAVDLGQRQVREILLEVRPSNEPALAFYRSLGFAEEGRRAGYYDDPVEDAVLMRLKLGEIRGKSLYDRIEE